MGEFLSKTRLVAAMAIVALLGSPTLARANELCEFILTGLAKSTGDNRAARVVDLMVQHAKSKPWGVVSGYDSRMVAAADGHLHTLKRVPDARFIAANSWVPDRVPDAPLNVWNKLSPEEKFQVAKGLESIYSKSNFGIGIVHRYLNDGTYGEKLADNMKSLDRVPVNISHPNFQLPEDALANARGTVGFSGLLWLKAAKTGEPVGLCSNVACAMAQNLHSLGASPTEVALHYGKASDQYALTHFYLGLQVPELGTAGYRVYDGTPNFKPSEHLRGKRDGETGPDRSLELWSRRFTAQAGWEPNFLAPVKTGVEAKIPTSENTSGDLVTGIIRVVSDGDFGPIDRFIAAAPKPESPNEWDGEISDLERVLQFTKDRWYFKLDSQMFGPEDFEVRWKRLPTLGAHPRDIQNPRTMTARQFIDRLEVAITAIKNKRPSSPQLLEAGVN